MISDRRNVEGSIHFFFLLLVYTPFFIISVLFPRSRTGSRTGSIRVYLIWTAGYFVQIRKEEEHKCNKWSPHSILPVVLSLFDSSSISPSLRVLSFPLMMMRVICWYHPRATFVTVLEPNIPRRIASRITLHFLTLRFGSRTDLHNVLIALSMIQHRTSSNPITTGFFFVLNKFWRGQIYMQTKLFSRENWRKNTNRIAE